MHVTINGISKELATAATVSHLVAQFCKIPKNVITEINGHIVPNNEWDKVAVKDGDTIELVTFVGGG